MDREETILALGQLPGAGTTSSLELVYSAAFDHICFEITSGTEVIPVSSRSIHSSLPRLLLVLQDSLLLPYPDSECVGALDGHTGAGRCSGDVVAHSVGQLADTCTLCTISIYHDQTRHGWPLLIGFLLTLSKHH